MSYIKTAEEIEQLKEGGKILGGILEQIANLVKPGISAWEIDQEAERLIRKAGGRPAFKGYQSRKSDPPFPSTICACVNDELVHGIATKEKILKKGDIFSIDVGMEYGKKLEIPTQSSGQVRNGPDKARDPVFHREKLGGNKGYFTDTALTVIVGKVPDKTKELLNITQKALEIGISQCVVGNTVADIGKAIQKYVEDTGYGVVRDLVGHGVGHAVHEDPRVPNYYDKSLEKWKLIPGVVIAIEPMVTMGDWHIKTADDGWSISTVDKSLCAHFEHTVVITKDGPLVVTRRPHE